MSKIVLGTCGKKKVQIDLDELLRTRLLIQANSGGGKSYLLRRLAEEIFGKVPVIIIDPEGEFATLREKFGYVLVGKGGETPADPRSAAVVAQKLLELRASAVCDIYELKPESRQAWVRIFIQALVESPKNLWHPTVVIVDESHIFAPESGKAEAYGAITDLVTRGRKRGLCPILATQRLAKLSKNVSAELLNRLVGMTFEDIDLDRAADLLSVSRSDREKFEKEMKVLDPGQFYGLGRAISRERILIKIGGVQTTHPELGSGGYSAEPPPPPEKVKALLPKLADLPKMAEEKARTEADLRAEIRGLKAQLSMKEREVPAKVVQAPPKIERVEVPVVKDSQIKRLETILVRTEHSINVAKGNVSALEEAAREFRANVAKGFATHDARELAFKSALVRQGLVSKIPARPSQPVSQPVIPREQNGGVDPAFFAFTKPRIGILKALREFNDIDIDMPSRNQLAGWLGKKLSGTFRNDLSALRSAGAIDYNGDGVLLTAEGLRHAPGSEMNPTPDGVFSHVLQAVTGPQEVILKALREIQTWISRENLAEHLGLQMSGTFRNNLSSLHSAKMIDYGTGNDRNLVRLSPWTILGSEFRPVQMKGKSLSATLIEDRR